MLFFVYLLELYLFTTVENQDYSTSATVIRNDFSPLVCCTYPSFPRNYAWYRYTLQLFFSFAAFLLSVDLFR